MVVVHDAPGIGTPIFVLIGYFGKPLAAL